MREKSWIITEERANSLLPYLRWIGTNATRKKYRIAARSLLGRLEGVKDWKQILVTKTEEEMVAAIYGAFPDSSRPPKQLKLL